VTEIWANKNALDSEISIPGYSFFCKYRLVDRESMNEGDVPLNWRSANVTPIFKKAVETSQRITDQLAVLVNSRQS